MGWALRLGRALAISATLTLLAATALTGGEVRRVPGLRIRIFSAPAWCPPCKALHKWLTDKGFEQEMRFAVSDGTVLAVPLEMIDVDRQPSRELRTGGAIPEIQFLYQEQKVAVQLGALMNLERWREEIEKALVVYRRSVDAQAALAAGVWPGAGPSSGGAQPGPQSGALAGRLPVAAAGPSHAGTVAQIASGGAVSAGGVPGPAVGTNGAQTGASARFPSAAALLIGTGSDVATNPISVGLTLRLVRNILLSAFLLDSSQLIALFGYGLERPLEPESFEVNEWDRGHATHIEGIHPNLSFTPEHLDFALRELRDQNVTDLLIVSVGHGSPDGLLTWGSAQHLGATAFERALRDEGPKGTTVLVSGNCYGGRFAMAASCGFFAASPDRLATGCSPLASRRQFSETDYVYNFFASPEANRETFAQAHWYAAMRTDRQDIPYTSLDALAAQYFELHKPALPSRMAFADLLEAAHAHAPPIELLALVELAGKAAPEFIYLKPLTISYSAQGRTADETTVSGQLHLVPEGQPPYFDRVTFSPDPGTRRLVERTGIDHLEAEWPVYQYDDRYAINPTVTTGHGYRARPNRVILMNEFPVELEADQFLPRRGLPLPTKLVTLARRVWFRKAAADGKLPASFLAEYRRIDACENQSIANFLRPASSGARGIAGGH